VYRLSAYRGVIQARIREQQEKTEQGTGKKMSSAEYLASRKKISPEQLAESRLKTQAAESIQWD